MRTWRRRRGPGWRAWSRVGSASNGELPLKADDVLTWSWYAEAPGIVSVYMSGRHLDELRAEPGQFFRWRFLAPGLRWTANPYSLSEPPRGQDLATH